MIYFRNITKDNILFIKYNDETLTVCYYPNNKTIIKDRPHRKAMQRKLKTKNVCIGDIVYNKVFLKEQNIFKSKKSNISYVLERNNVILEYSIIIDSNLINQTREVLFEKHKRLNIPQKPSLFF
jgi:hypothetical protein